MSLPKGRGTGSALPPTPLPMQVADVGAGSQNLVIGLLAAVIRRSTTGEGARVDISMFDGSLAFNNMGAAQAIVSGQNPTAEGTTLNGGTFYDLYETQDGRLLSIGSLEPKFWAGFCHAIGRTDLMKRGQNFDPANQRTFKPEIRQIIKSKTLAEWSEIFAQYDVCVEPVLTTTEALEHPQTLARQMVVEVPRTNGTTQRQIGTPIKLSNHTPDYKHIGVKIGTHTQEILAELGFCESEIEALKAQGVVATGRKSEIGSRESGILRHLS